jgi:hypothetical protein
MSFWKSSVLRKYKTRVSTISPIFIFLKDNAADIIPVLLAQVTYVTCGLAFFNIAEFRITGSKWHELKTAVICKMLTALYIE